MNGYLVLGAFITAVLALAGTIYTARSARMANREQATVAPYADIVKRLAALEEKVEMLERREQVLIHHLRDLWTWISRGARGKPPAIPVELHKILDPAWYAQPPVDD